MKPTATQIRGALVLCELTTGDVGKMFGVTRQQISNAIGGRGRYDDALRDRIIVLCAGRGVSPYKLPEGGEL